MNDVLIQEILFNNNIIGINTNSPSNIVSFVKWAHSINLKTYNTAHHINILQLTSNNRATTSNSGNNRFSTSLLLYCTFS